MHTLPPREPVVGYIPAHTRCSTENSNVTPGEADRQAGRGSGPRVTDWGSRYTRGVLCYKFFLPPGSQSGSTSFLPLVFSCGGICLGSCFRILPILLMSLSSGKDVTLRGRFSKNRLITLGSASLFFVGLWPLQRTGALSGVRLNLGSTQV